MERIHYIIFDALVDGIIISAPFNFIRQGHYETVLGLAIGGMKIIYDFEMMKNDEPLTCSGLVHYGKEYLIKGIKGLKNKVKNQFK